MCSIVLGFEIYLVNFALEKYLPNVIFGIIISLLRFSLLRSNEIKLAKYRSF